MDNREAICLPYVPSSKSREEPLHLGGPAPRPTSPNQSSVSRPAFEMPPQSSFFLDLLHFIFAHELAVIFYVLFGPPLVFDVIYFLANNPLNNGDAQVIGGVNMVYWVVVIFVWIIWAALTYKGGDEGSPENDTPRSKVISPDMIALLGKSQPLCWSPSSSIAPASKSSPLPRATVDRPPVNLGGSIGRSNDLKCLR